MSNMSYCRMENTYNDLLDVHNHWEDAEGERELKYREKILNLCERIVGTFDEDEDEDEGSMEQFEISIKGAGTSNEIAVSLHQIADEIEAENHVDVINEKGSVEWEDVILITKISEV